MTTPNAYTPPPTGPGADYSATGSEAAPGGYGYDAAPAGYGAPTPGYDAYPVATVPQPGYYQNGPSGKTRSPIGVFLLSIITFGIYGLVWYYKVNVELKNFNPAIQVNPVNMILLCVFVPYFMLFSVYYTGKRIQQAQASAGLPSATSPAVGVLLAIVIGGHSFYYQDALNTVWQHRQA